MGTFNEWAWITAILELKGWERNQLSLFIGRAPQPAGRCTGHAVARRNTMT